METPPRHESRNRLEMCRQALEANGFEAFVSATPAEAGDLVIGEILPRLEAKSFSWGDSLTMQATGILDKLLVRPGLEVIRTFEPGVERGEGIERRRRALLVDLFLTGSNAVTEGGQLVNLDMVANRVAAIAFGPKRVIIFAGRNKIVPSLEAAMDRVRELAAPANAMRHAFATPCARTGCCHDCDSPQRICNTWTITEKSFPRGRVTVILIDQDLGL
ncbi:MAG: lactate utilization protein [Desulfuromonas sp.]|uniref:lactate utilization protein n=1 Tax=Desulfuromonas sp. TaxID=892 RepID=UPI000CB6F8D5|nr:lactate utilization protein [Desulfuromonas sp.]PLX85173.1 MAG: lactate utilization protein [Desulfuromonas sp.]